MIKLVSMITRELIEANSVVYSERFNIDLKRDPFPWFLLAVLFGARISESVALRTFFMFRTERLLSPEAILDAGWDRLVGVLDSGGYTRYDFRTATKLGEMSKNIIEKGGLNLVHDRAEGSEELVEDLKALAKGIGDVTVGIFMREMVGVWEKARPHPSPLVLEGAKFLGIDIDAGYMKFDVTYARFESFLLKVAKECVRRKKKASAGFCEVLLS